MAAETTFYNLYEVKDRTNTKLVIVKAIRPEYPNYDQNEEDRAWKQLEINRILLIKNFCNKNKFISYRFLAEYMGFPLGDIFYSPQNYAEVSVWLSRTNSQSFAFGKCQTEEKFWQELEQDYLDNNCYFYSELTKPAEKHNIIFIQ